MMKDCSNSIKLFHASSNKMLVENNCWFTGAFNVIWELMKKQNKNNTLF